MGSNESDSGAGRPAQPKQPASETAEAAPAGGTSQGQKPTAHESDLFPAADAPRYFGTGSYGTGGSTNEGNDGIGDLNPLGGYGSFTDAGGPGSPTLYGEETPTPGSPPSEPDTIQPDRPEPAKKGSGTPPEPPRSG